MIFMATTTPKKPPTTPGPIVPAQQPGGGDSVVLERVPLKVKPPQMYQVVMLNDDYTPMEFVVVVIQEFFGKDRETATQIMLKIHLDGKGVCGVYSRDVAHQGGPGDGRRARGRPPAAVRQRAGRVGQTPHDGDEGHGVEYHRTSPNCDCRSLETVVSLRR